MHNSDITSIILVGGINDSLAQQHTLPAPQPASHLVASVARVAHVGGGGGAASHVAFETAVRGHSAAAPAATGFGVVVGKGAAAADEEDPWILVDSSGGTLSPASSHLPPTSSSQQRGGPGAAATIFPEWTHNSAVKGCMVCDKAFGILRHRHHCRECGKVVVSRARL